MSDSPSKDGYLKYYFQDAKLADMMSQPATTIGIDEDFSEVEETFVSKGIRHLPVVDNEGKIQGIITQRDLYRVVSPRKFLQGQVEFRKDIIVDEDGVFDKEALNLYILENVMVKNPRVLKKDDTVGHALHIMVRNRIGCVPVVNDDQTVCGIITRFDILRMADKIIQEYSAQ